MAGLAHELNSPVGAIKSTADVSGRGLAKIGGLLEAVSRGEGSVERVQPILQLLQRNEEATPDAVGRLSRIVESLKTFTNLDQAEFQRLDVHEGLDSAITLLEHRFRDRISVVRNSGQLPLVYGYPSELNQVYMNVLLNAHQAIEGEGTIEVRTRNEDGRVLVEIEDDGRGIPAHRLRSVFDPSLSLKGARVGLGLGLPLSFNIMRRHGGDLKLTSEPGKGTVVTVVLPLSAEET